ncbi:MAG: hypothetical protein AAFQ82_27995 [Myxococcota bacterium]
MRLGPRAFRANILLSRRPPEDPASPFDQELENELIRLAHEADREHRLYQSMRNDPVILLSEFIRLANRWLEDRPERATVWPLIQYLASRFRNWDERLASP